MFYISNTQLPKCSFTVFTNVIEKLFVSSSIELKSEKPVSVTHETKQADSIMIT